MRNSTLLLLLFLSGCSRVQQAPQPQVNQAKFEGLYRAGKTVDAAVGVSVTLPKFRELVQAFATELSIAKDRASVAEERRLVDLYADALNVYRDSLALWDAQIDQHSKIADFNAGLLCYGDVQEIAARYGLPCVEYGPDGMKVVPNESQQYLWSVAGVKLRKANASYLSDAKLEGAKDPEVIKTAMYLLLNGMIESDKAARDPALARCVV